MDAGCSYKHRHRLGVRTAGGVGPFVDIAEVAVEVTRRPRAIIRKRRYAPLQEAAS
jgi:hypothetical protein